MKKKTDAWRWIFIGVPALALIVAFSAFMYYQPSRLDQQPAEEAVVERSFGEQYPKAPEDHIFVRVNAEETKQLLSEGTGVLFLGFPECPWCQGLVPHLDASAKAAGVDRIAYFNIREDREDNSRTYQAILDKLEPFLNKDENGKPRVYVPHVVIVKNGEIVGNYKIQLDAGGDTRPTPDTFWTEENIATARQQMEEEIAKLGS